MKKTTLLLSLSAAFLAGLFFTSCSSEKNMVIEKRHYGNGYYVHRSGVKNNLSEVKTTGNVTSEQAFVVVPEKTTEVKSVATPQELNTTIAVPVQAKQKTVVAQKPAVAVKDKTTELNVTTTQHNAPLALNKKQERKNSAGGDVPAIVLAILCIFIPPLAVFLSEGDINNKFWIDLVLCIFFFLPGIIYAFYVCFA